MAYTSYPDLLKLLAHDLRWQLVTHLAHSDYRVQELCQLTNEAQNVVSYHLKQLRTAELVSEHRSSADARDIYYQLNLARLRADYGAAGRLIHPVLMPHPNNLTTNNLRYPHRVIFLCTHNSARSQIAEGILRSLSQGQIDVVSAGTEPTKLHPLAIFAMKEMSISIRKQRSKHIDEFAGQTFDYAISVCDRARENCPPFAEPRRTLHWSFPDPVAVTGSKAQRMQSFAEVAHQMSNRIRYFLVMHDQSEQLNYERHWL